jgi:putative endonuclease
MAQRFYVFIMTNPRNTVVYTGVTNNLARRVQEHKEKLVEGFTAKYNVTKLVYHERFDDVRAAIAREKQLKGGSRQKKNDLVDSVNPEWRDLSQELS